MRANLDVDPDGKILPKNDAKNTHKTRTPSGAFLFAAALV